MDRRLAEYRRKRDFTRTDEPAGGQDAAQGNLFVVHKHSATADHYDLRLQSGNVLKCWAVPKGPSLNPADRRLAVETEDHPIEYASFEGVIPEGQYGAGPMILWDRGTYATSGDIDKDLARGEFKFRLAGEKLHGGFMLVRLKPKEGEKRKNWLLIKERDFAADEEEDIRVTRPESVKSGRKIEDLAAPAAPAAAEAPARLSPGRLAGAKKASFPTNIAPQLATLAEAAPEGSDWLHEIKYDGYRTMAYRSGKDVRLITRGGHDWTKRYGSLAASFLDLPCREAVIDGEIVSLDDKGVSHFGALQEALAAGNTEGLVFFAFDLLHLNGWDLRKVPLIKRKEQLRRLLGQPDPARRLQFSDHFIGDGGEFFEQCSRMGLEGVVSKRQDASYESGRTKSWLKVKSLAKGDFPIVGFTRSAAAGGLGALALGEEIDGQLRHVGAVGTGYDTATAGELLARLEDLADPQARLEGMAKNVVPVRPVLTARVLYSNRTKAGALRHPVFAGLREAQLSSRSSAPRRRLISDSDLAAIWVTNSSRRLFGRSGPTKLDIALYYAAIGDYMLPHILHRPVSLFRCPTGKLEDCFYQRHAFAGMPEGVLPVEMKNGEGEEKKAYIAVGNAKGYLALAQFGIVEFHSWGAKSDQPEKPDRLIFDLDPGEGVGWKDIVAAAIHVRGELEKRGLVPFVKTSGGSGLHVVTPLKRKHGWKKLHETSAAIASAISAGAKEIFVTTMGKANRKNRIFLDFHRNARTATAAAPYSLRAKAKLTASTPLHWSDLESVDAPQDLNYSSLPQLLELSGDPWVDVDANARPLPEP